MQQSLKTIVLIFACSLLCCCNAPQMQSNMFPHERAVAGEENHRVGSSTSLITASTSGVVRVVRRLLNEGANVDEQDSEGFTPLIGASANGHLEVVQCLVAKAKEREGYEGAKAMINAKSDTGMTPLMAAVLGGHKEVAAYLLSVGAEVDATDQAGYTALYHAAVKGDVAMVQLLLDNAAQNNADVNKQEPELGATALMFAASKGNEAMVRCLLAHGAKVHIKNNAGWTALCYATRAGHVEVVKLLQPRTSV